MHDHSSPAARPIVFLDIDGVLNGHQFNEAAESCSIDPACVARLNGLLLRTDAEMVVSSAWRYMVHGGAMTHCGFEYLLRTHGVLAGRLKGFIDRDEEEPGQTRGHLISDYLWSAKVIAGFESPYVVIDDLPASEFRGLPFVRTDGSLGLTDADVRHADLLFRIQGVRRGRTRME